MGENDVVTPTEFNRLESEVSRLGDIVDKFSGSMQELTLAIRDNIKDSDNLQKGQEFHRSEFDKLWGIVSTQGKDIDTAHGKIRSGKLAAVCTWTVSVFFLALMQGLIVWWGSNFVERADRDHDLLVQLSTNQNYILRWIQSHEKRNTSSWYEHESRDGGEYMAPPQEPNTTYKFLPYPRTPLERQPTQHELYPKWSLRRTVDLQPKI